MHPDPSATPLLDQPLYLLSLVGRRARAAASEGLAQAHLTLGHVAVLAVLADSDRASQREIGRLIGKDPSDVVALLDEMEGSSLVRRDPDPSDRRRHLVTLTSRGKRAFKRAGSILDAATAAFFETLEPELAGRLRDVASQPGARDIG